MYLNIIQLAESLGVPEGQIEDWIREEELPCIRDGARLSFDRAQVIEWATGRGLVPKAGFLAAGAQPSGLASPLAEFLRLGGVWRQVTAAQVLPVLEQIVARLPGATPDILRLLAQRLHSPQALNWAPVGEGIALPHLRVPVALGRNAGVLALLRLSEPATLPQPPPDGVPVTTLFFFVAPSPRAHLEIVGALSAHLLHGRLRALLAAGAADEEFMALLARPPERKAS